MIKIANTGLVLAMLIAATTTPSMAQTAGDDEALRAQQEELFQRMLTAPDDLDVMFQHALVSIAIKDFEAAISTLERMLIFNPQLSRAKVELGAAYFRLGAYENARFYFNDVLENDDPPPEVRRRVQGFLDEIGRRTRESGASFVASFGATYSSNANLGPPDNQVFVGENLAILNQEFVESDDFGFRGTLSARHFIDLNQPDGDIWITDANLFTLHYIDETRGDLDSVAVRTGPRISLDEQNYGPKIRPFVLADLVRSNNDLLYFTGGVGFEYSDTLTDQMNLFVSAQSAWREFDDRDGFDGHTHRASVGLAYTPDPSFTMTGVAFAETDRTSDDFNSNIEVGARLGGVYRYDSGLEYTDRLWSLSGFVATTFRRFDEPNPNVRGSVTREDFDLRFGASHVFHLTDGWFVQADADYLLRESNIGNNFDIDNLGVALSVGRSF